MCVCIIEFVVVLFKMLSCIALCVVSVMCLFADCWEVVCLFFLYYLTCPSYHLNIVKSAPKESEMRLLHE
jgi:hypothetical protein